MSTVIDLITHRAGVFAAVEMERRRQEELCGKGPLERHKALHVLGEEFGEVCRALENTDPVNLRDELVQVAAVACRWLEYLHEFRFDCASDGCDNDGRYDSGYCGVCDRRENQGRGKRVDSPDLVPPHALEVLNPPILTVTAPPTHWRVKLPDGRLVPLCGDPNRQSAMVTVSNDLDMVGCETCKKMVAAGMTGRCHLHGVVHNGACMDCAANVPHRKGCDCDACCNVSPGPEVSREVFQRLGIVNARLLEMAKTLRRHARVSSDPAALTDAADEVTGIAEYVHETSVEHASIPWNGIKPIDRDTRTELAKIMENVYISEQGDKPPVLWRRSSDGTGPNKPLAFSELLSIMRLAEAPAVSDLTKVLWVCAGGCGAQEMVCADEELLDKCVCCFAKEAIQIAKERGWPCDEDKIRSDTAAMAKKRIDGQEKQ